MWAGQGDSATNDDGFRVQQVDQVGDADRQELGRVGHHLVRMGVAEHHGFVDRGRGYACEVAVHQIGEERPASGLETLDSSRRDVGARRVCFEATVVPALALPASEVDGHVTDLAGGVRSAVEDLPVNHDTATDSRADGDAHELSEAAARALPPLAVDRAVRVVVQHGGHPGPLDDQVSKREVLPPQVRRVDHDTALSIQRPR